jgi:hypothetical protein
MASARHRKITEEPLGAIEKGFDEARRNRPRPERPPTLASRVE